MGYSWLLQPQALPRGGVIGKGLRLGGGSNYTYFICLTIVLFPDSPAPEETNSVMEVSTNTRGEVMWNPSHCLGSAAMGWLWVQTH